MRSRSRGEVPTSRCTSRGMVPRSAAAGPVARPRRRGRRRCAVRSGCSADFRHEQNDPARFYGALAADSVGQLARLPRPRRRTVLDVGGGPGLLPGRVRGRGCDVLARSTPTWARCPDSATIATGTVVGDGMSLPFRDGAFDVCYSSNVLEHVSRPVGHGRGDAARDAAGRHRLRLLHGLVRPVGRPRDRAVALPRRRSRPSPLRRTARPRAQEQVRRVAVRRSRCATGSRWARTQQRRRGRSTSSPATTRAGPAGCCACPALREVATWNLVIVVREA